MSSERLHKVLAAAGIASRRKAEELIAEGHVTVDGVQVRAMGVMVDPETQDIRFDGEKIAFEKPGYYLVWKPRGYICSAREEWGKKSVVSLVRDRQNRRLFPVGRLEEEAEGLIIVTNDGDFANKISHPRHGVEKTYRLKLHGALEPEAVDKVRQGVWLSDGRTAPMLVKLEKRSKHATEVSVTVRERYNRELRRAFAKVGHAVDRLVRIRIGSITARGLKRGQARVLTPVEVDSLRELVGKGATAAPKVAKPGKAPSAKGTKKGAGVGRGAPPRGGSRVGPKPQGKGPGRPSGRGGPRPARRPDRGGP